MERSAAPTPRSHRFALWRAAALCGAGFASVTLLGAASPKLPDASFQAQDVAPMGQEVAVPAPIRVQTVMFEPAPVPNPDANGPAGASGPAGGIAPRLFSSKNEFEGDGYSYGSSQSATLDARKQPAAGLGLSVPLIK